MELRVIKIDSNLTHLALVGRLDLPGAQSVETTLLELTEGRGRPALVDLSEVTYLSSGGIRILLRAAKGLNKHGSKMVILKPPQQVKDSLMHVELGKVIPIEDDFERATSILMG